MTGCRLSKIHLSNLEEKMNFICFIILIVLLIPSYGQTGELMDVRVSGANPFFNLPPKKKSVEEKKCKEQYDACMNSYDKGNTSTVEIARIHESCQRKNKICHKLKGMSGEQTDAVNQSKPYKKNKDGVWTN